jgi:hypothetical protein
MRRTPKSEGGAVVTKAFDQLMQSGPDLRWRVVALATLKDVEIHMHRREDHVGRVHRVARWCLSGNRQMSNNEISAAYDVIVVGGGAADLSGALVLARSRRSVLVIDSGEPRNAPAAAMHHFLSRDGMNPLALLEVAGLRSAAMVARYWRCGYPVGAPPLLRNRPRKAHLLPD